MRDISRWAWVVLATSGCLFSDEEPSAGPDAGQEDAAVIGSAKSPLTTAQAKTAGKVLAAELEDAATRFGPKQTIAALAAACVSKSGDETDPDGDGIPTSLTVDIDCSARRFGYEGTLSGSESVVDTQPNKVAWAFTVDSSLEAAYAGRFGGSATLDVTGTLRASQESLFGPFLLTGDLVASTVLTSANGSVFEIAEDIGWTVSYTPDVSWAPGGGAVVTGSLAAEGAWNVRVDDYLASTTLTTPIPLVFDPECKPGRITAGAVRANFEYEGQVGSIRVEWTGCGTTRVAYNPDFRPGANASNEDPTNELDAG